MNKRADQEGGIVKMKLLKRLYREEEGAGLVEYAMLVALIAIVVAASVTIFQGQLSAFFESISARLPLMGGGGGTPAPQ